MEAVSDTRGADRMMGALQYACRIMLIRIQNWRCERLRDLFVRFASGRLRSRGEVSLISIIMPVAQKK
jgi:hypothetical protein